MSRKGFTLIEVIIVIVILGVLASIALPKMTGQMEAARAAEAMNMFGFIRRTAQNCYDSANSADSCTTFAALGIGAPDANAMFTYRSGTVASVQLNVKATRKASTNCICMTVMLNSGSVFYGVFPADNPYTGIISRTGYNSIAPGSCGGFAFASIDM